MTTDLHSLAAPYALGALGAEERLVFEDHISHCDDCAAELPGFLATAARLADATASAPPAQLKSQLMRSISQTRQERPGVVSLAEHRRRRILPRIAMAAATLLTAVSIGGYVSEHEQRSDLEAERAAVISIMSANDAEISKASLSDGGMAKMIASKGSNKAVVLTDGLPSLEDGHVYQLWTITDDVPTSAGLIEAGSDISVMGGVSNVERVALTVEPAGGSQLPTTKPIAMMTAT